MTRDWEWDYHELVDPGLECDPRNPVIVAVAPDIRELIREEKEDEDDEHR